MNVLFVCFCFLLAGILNVFSRPATEENPPVEIESILDEKEGNGTVYAYMLSDGTLVFRRTYTKLVNGVEIVVQEGQYSFIGTDKLLHRTAYVSDERGTRSKSTTSNMTGFIEDSIDTKLLISIVG